MPSELWFDLVLDRLPHCSIDRICVWSGLTAVAWLSSTNRERLMNDEHVSRSVVISWNMPVHYLFCKKSFVISLSVCGAEEHAMSVSRSTRAHKLDQVVPPIWLICLNWSIPSQPVKLTAISPSIPGSHLQHSTESPTLFFNNWKSTKIGNQIYM